MSAQDPMIEVFLFETEQLLENLEDLLLQGEKQSTLNDEQINEIFRIMHTIKGSASMMSFDSIAQVAHAAEDMFSQIRESKPKASDWEHIFDIVLSANDHLKESVAQIQLGEEPQEDDKKIADQIHKYLNRMISGGDDEPEDEADDIAGDVFIADNAEDVDAPFYKIKVSFEPDSKMENMRAFGLVTELKRSCLKMAHIPADLMSEGAAAKIAESGFTLYIQSNENPDDIKSIIDGVMFIQNTSLIAITEDNEDLPEEFKPHRKTEEHVDDSPARLTAEISTKQNFISVNVNKLDKLMNLVGEIVTTESMVTKNPEIVNLHLEGFERSADELKKLIDELQEIVMSVRMLPVSTTFNKMHRIVRDMSKKVSKEVNLVIIGEETEVDKNIIDNLSDPLMHLIRNAVDHGIESAEERKQKGKPGPGTITLEARNTGGDVMILISDDGGGLDRNAILKKAGEKGLLTKPESEISDKEAFAMIFAPGFSTNEVVTEYSGRGVGMDVVRRNIEKVSGSITLESEKDKGTSFIIRIPLTLAIIEGMKLRVGKLIFIVPMLSIYESFKPNMENVFLDPDGNELIMIRGECYPILRLHRVFDLVPEVEELQDGILIMIHTDNDAYCLFADELIGEQQAVIKPLPPYIQKHNNNMHGIGGCAILGDGSISLIIDINNLAS